jgi:hypothetical protein
MSDKKTSFANSDDFGTTFGGQKTAKFWVFFWFFAYISKTVGRRKIFFYTELKLIKFPKNIYITRFFLSLTVYEIFAVENTRFSKNQTLMRRNTNLNLRSYK